MDGEQVAELPEELREWVQQRAAETDQEPAAVLARSVAAYRFIEGESDALVATDGQRDGVVIAPEDGEERLTSLDDSIAELAERVAELEGDVDEKIEDVRERVVQVKREADSKAPAEHDHGELRERLTEAVEAARESGETAREAAEAVEDLSGRVDSGFDNYEDVLEYLTDTTDDLEVRAEKLARIAIDLRESVSDLQGEAAAREAVAELQEEANSKGITEATCGSCDADVQLGLLSSPHCPECEATFSDVEPGGRFFRPATLRTGDRPALESGEDEQEPSSPAELFDDYEPETEGDERG